MTFSPAFTRFLLISQLASWVLLLFLLFTRNAGIQSASEVLTAKRINIVNEDGTTVIALAGKEHIAAPRMDGKEYPVELIERQHMAGMIFFNEAGDEMGGLVFNSGRHSSGKPYAIGHLSFDRFRDNQVINLEHKENIHGTVKSGITFYDRRGDGSFGQNLDLLQEYWTEGTTDERKKEIQSTLKDMKAQKALGAERVFLGSHNRIPQLSLKDTLGQDRIRLFVDEENVARLQFYDEVGELVEEFPGQDENAEAQGRGGI